ncbi:MAG: NAD(+) diphosphatase [Pseudomonadota bacterium]
MPSPPVDPYLCTFAAEPLDRASPEHADADAIAALQARDDVVLAPLLKGEPLAGPDGLVLFGAAARDALPPDHLVVFLGTKNGAPYFAVEIGAVAERFAGLGAPVGMRDAAGLLSPGEAALVGRARWVLDWHRRNPFCARCGAASAPAAGGMKRVCPACGTEHFPRTDPVVIVLVEHDDAVLLARGAKFPPGYYSALAGFVEAAETPEACVVREVREEVGVAVDAVRYQFSQPWPFPASLMLGFFARAGARDLTLDRNEIVDAKWVARADVRAMIDGAGPPDLLVPPPVTIARRLLERWANA